MRFMQLSNKSSVLFTSIITLSLTGCNSALLSPKGQIAIEQRSLIITAFCLMLIVVIPAIAMALIFAWRYRASNTNAKYSPNWSHSNKIEAVIWTVPILIIVFLALLVWRTTHALEPSKPLAADVAPVKIDVVALDWKWLFIYPELGIATVNQIAFPANTPVQFRVTSYTVMNSFFIPTLGSQIYAMAGMQTRLNLIANEPGEFKGISANYSGHGFSGMKFKVNATKDDTEFQQWVDQVKASPNQLLSMDDFKRVAKPSENQPVEYFSAANPDLFLQIIATFGMEHGDMPMSHHSDMNHAVHATAEEH